MEMGEGGGENLLLCTSIKSFEVGHNCIAC